MRVQLLAKNYLPIAKLDNSQARKGRGKEAALQ